MNGEKGFPVACPDIAGSFRPDSFRAACSGLIAGLKAHAGNFPLFERRCCHCHAPFLPGKKAPPQFDSLCPECRPLLAPYNGHRCGGCGEPFLDAPQKICPECTGKPPPWQAHAYYGLYRGSLRDLVLRFKYDGEICLAGILSEFLLAASGCLPLPDAVLAVPQHPEHLRSRGYNQAHELARLVARAAALPFESGLIRRTRQGAPQAGLDAEQRTGNVRGSFLGSAGAAGKKIWLVDDVLTTGSTMAEATRALLAAGAKSVSALFVARTPAGEIALA